MACDRIDFSMSRRDFFGRFGLAGAALASLLERDAAAAPALSIDPARGILSGRHPAPRARRVIYLFMSGGPSQHDLFDYKPLLNERNGQDLPASVRMGQRLTGMSANQAALPLDSSYTYNHTGTGVTAYIVDTGIRYDHVEFEGRARPGFDAGDAKH